MMGKSLSLKFKQSFNFYFHFFPQKSALTFLSRKKSYKTPVAEQSSLRGRENLILENFFNALRQLAELALCLRTSYGAVGMLKQRVCGKNKKYSRFTLNKQKTVDFGSLFFVLYGIIQLEKHFLVKKNKNANRK